MLIKNYDTRNAGRLNVVNFKTCLLNAKLQLSVTEVNRIARYVEKINEEIDYWQFLELVRTSSDKFKDK